MPRRSIAPGRKWVSVELEDRDHAILTAAAKKDRRSLNVFLQIALGELAAKIELETLLERTVQEQGGAGTTATVQEQSRAPK
jgi:predicted HicB family RNase H-like nuclease